MPDKKKCFIIMPITTPEDWIPRYRNDKIHFHHVLDHLFLPAIELAEFNPIEPIAKGADNIPAEIIKNLDDADLVLCDLSIFNPNVFFELGIRTALNKPICLVRDEYAEKIPFDISDVNFYKYKSALEHWEMADEVKHLSQHLIDSFKRSHNKNPIWKYYGIKAAATSLEGGTQDDKLNIILKKIDRIKINTDDSSNLISSPHPDELNKSYTSGQFFDVINSYVKVKYPHLKINSTSIDHNNKVIDIQIINIIPEKKIIQIESDIKMFLFSTITFPDYSVRLRSLRKE